MSRILFLCPDVKHATGGVQKIYEFAQALHYAGYSAFLVHRDNSFRPSWFESNIPVVARKDTTVLPDDLLVLPEFMESVLPQFAGCAKVILYQNTFGWSDANYIDTEIVTIISVSEYIYRHSSFSCPKINNFRIHMGYNKTLFHASNCDKKKQITFMPRKRSEDSKKILAALKARAVLNDWTVVPLDGLSAREVANVMRESMIFLSFSKREGFGLPPLEAMACGCLVVGFHGHGGAEFFDPDYCFPIPEDDICLFQETLVRLLLDPGLKEICMVKGAAAAHAVSQKYTMQRQKEDVINAFSACIVKAKELKGLEPVALRRIKFEPSRFRTSARHLKKALLSLVGKDG